MANPSKAKGTAAETAVVGYLRENGFPFAARLPLSGSRDIGDVGGITDTTIEVKAVKTLKLPEFMAQLRKEMENADDAYGVAIIKRVGKTDVGTWYAVMETEMWVDLMRQFTDLAEALSESNAENARLERRIKNATSH